MSVFHHNILAGASGAGGAAEALYVDDVFSTFLANGAGGQTITNGIDLSTEGGMVWSKARAVAVNWGLHDTERGVNKFLSTNTNSSETDVSGTASHHTISSFNTDGFTTGNDGGYGVVDLNGYGSYAHFTFRKAPGFFDVVTYTGNGSNRTIAHNLGSVPGFIIIKALNDTRHWWCFHRSIGNTMAIPLSTNGSTTTAQAYWNNTSPTDTVFTVGTDADVNANNTNYVAYVFAHDDQSFGTDSDEAIIKCGSYSATNSDGNFVNLGFEPQWVLTKNTTRSENWSIWDNMRGVMTGWSSSADNDVALHPNTTGADYPAGNVIDFNPTGFTLNSGSGLTNWNTGETFIYVAIRRPHKPPTAGTEVFDDVAYTGNSSTQDISISPSIADSVLIKRRTAGDNWGWANRLTGKLQHLTPNSNAAEATRAAADAVEFDRQSAFGLVGNSSGEVNYSGETLISYSFKRAPGFFDVVTYTGDGASSRNVSHNLGSAAELIIVKRRNASGNWIAWSEGLTNNYILQLNGTDAEIAVGTGYVNSSTSTTFNIGNDSDVNANGSTYIAYLFDTLAGISKVGTYTGSNSTTNVDCGFSSGARFVLIRRFSPQLTTNNWHVFDAARGIVSGNDPFLYLNASTAENSSNDYIDPLSSGFSLPGGNPEINTSGSTYLFLAIA